MLSYLRGEIEFKENISSRRTKNIGSGVLRCRLNKKLKDSVKEK
jgi:hypothetical protein